MSYLLTASLIFFVGLCSRYFLVSDKQKNLKNIDTKLIVKFFTFSDRMMEVKFIRYIIFILGLISFCIICLSEALRPF